MKSHSSGSLPNSGWQLPALIIYKEKATRCNMMQPGVAWFDHPKSWGIQLPNH